MFKDFTTCHTSIPELKYFIPGPQLRVMLYAMSLHNGVSSQMLMYSFTWYFPLCWTPHKTLTSVYWGYFISLLLSRRSFCHYPLGCFCTFLCSTKLCRLDLFFQIPFTLTICQQLPFLNRNIKWNQRERERETELLSSHCSNEYILIVYCTDISKRT